MLNTFIKQKNKLCTFWQRTDSHSQWKMFWIEFAQNNGKQSMIQWWFSSVWQSWSVVWSMKIRQYLFFSKRFQLSTNGLENFSIPSERKSSTTNEKRVKLDGNHRNFCFSKLVKYFKTWHRFKIVDLVLMINAIRAQRGSRCLKSLLE